MKPTALDELPVHQAPLPMARVASSDRNFYDRCYLNGHDRTGEVFFVAGIGQYPNLGVRDGFLSVRIGDAQHVVRASDALDERTTRQEVGPLRLEVVEPLHRLRLHCDHDDIAADLMWTGSFDAVLEQRHLLLSGNRPILDASASPRSAPGRAVCASALTNGTSTPRPGSARATARGASVPPATPIPPGGRRTSRSTASGGSMRRCASTTSWSW